MGLGWGELLVIAVIVLLVVGGKRLPDLGRSLGQALREFQNALRGTSRKDDDRRDGSH